VIEWRKGLLVAGVGWFSTWGAWSGCFSDRSGRKARRRGGVRRREAL